MRLQSSLLTTISSLIHLTTTHQPPTNNLPPTNQHPLSPPSQPHHQYQHQPPNNPPSPPYFPPTSNGPFGPTQFAGLTTFGNLPWHPALHTPPDSPLQKYDIAILGAPFDTATTYRPGARFGPPGIRRGSARISPDWAWSAYDRRNVFRDWASIVDVGDASLLWLDNRIAMRQLSDAHRAVAGREANCTAKGSVPRVVTLGGDHTTTLAALRATVEHWGPVSVLHFDSHIDTWDPVVFGDDFSDYAAVNHGTFLHVAHAEGLVREDASMHVGIRAPVSNPSYDWENDARCGFEIITARDLDFIGVRGVIERIKNRVGESNVYVSVDIDVLDPAFAPGTGTMEPGGWSSRELLSVLDGLGGLRVIGADVVEVAPAYDSAGEITVTAAAEVVVSLLRLMVDTPVKALRDLI